MPQILDLGENGVHELPDGLSPQELQNFADSFKKPTQPAWQTQMADIVSRNFPVFNPEEQRIDVADIPQNRLQFEIAGATQTPRTFEKLPDYREIPLIEAVAETIPKAGGRLLDELGTGIYEGGVDVLQRGAEVAQGLPRELQGHLDPTTQEAIKTYPKPVQVGIKVGEGLTKSAPRLAVAAVNPTAGAVSFGLTPEGFDPKAAIIAGALPFIGSKAGLITESIALKTGLSNPEVLQALNRIGGVSGAAALIGADEALKISQLPPEQREEAWLNAAANVGSQFLLGAVGKMERPGISKVAEAIDTAPLETGRQVIEPAILKSELPPRIAPPEMLPELQRVSELVNKAIQESQQKIIVPGQPSALELLRKQAESLVEVPARVQKPETGFERPAEEVARGRTVAKKPMPEEAVVEKPQEAAPVVIEETAPPKPTALPETEAAYNLETKPEIATTGTGERKNSYGDPSGTTYKANADDWAVWQDVSKKPLTEPGVWATREAIKNKYGGMPPEAPAENPKKITSPKPQESKPPEQTIFGYSWEDIKSAQQGGRLSKAIRGSAEKPQAKESDFAALEKYGADGLYDREMYGVIDRLGLPMERPSSNKSAKEATTKTGTEPLTIEQKLEGLKFDETGESRLYSLPHPDAIKQIGKQLWNDSIDVAIASIKAGKVVKDAIGDAITHIKRNAKSYDETQIKANLEQILREEGITPQKPVKKPAVATEGIAQPVSQKDIEVPEGQKPRSFSARATTSERIPTDVQEQIRTSERSSYTPQDVSEVRARVKQMPDTELWDTNVNSPLYTEAKAELADRLFKSGRKDSAFDVIQSVSEELTRLGQIINQAKLLNSLSPELKVLALDKSLQKAGKDPLNESQRRKMIELDTKVKKAQEELDAATKDWVNEKTKENADKADKLLEAKTKADLELQRFANAFDPKTWPKLLKSILQGNLLTPMSEVVNIVSNLSFAPFRGMSRAAQSAFDITEAYMMGNETRTSRMSPVSGAAETARGFVRGAKQIPDIIKRGTGATVVGETRAGLQPLKAWQNLFSDNPEMATTQGKKTLNDKMKLLVEGTFGVPAEVMLRGLGVGDAPFREAARARVITEQLQLKNIPREQWSMAQKFPELFFDKQTLEQIRGDTLASIFQRESPTLNTINKWIAGKGDWADFGISLVAPYKVTPWNIIGEIMSFNPVVALAKTMNSASKGDRRATNMNAGKLLVGSMLTTTGMLLYKNGLLAPSLDARDEQQKERILSGEVLPPNHINISGLERYMEGGDPNFQPGDKTVDIFRAGGLAGAIFYMTANVGRDMEKNPEGDTSDMLWSLATQSTLEQARFGMNQSFLSGVETLLSSVKDGTTDKAVNQLANTVMSVPLPNTLSTLSRATREAKPDFDYSSFKKSMESLVRNRLGVFGMDDYLPLKRGLWGEPLRETPKDKSALLHHFFDVSRGQQITSDPKAIELYKLWRKTDNSKVIPSLVEKNQTFGKETYVLNPDQQSDLAEKVGGIRKEIVESLVTNPEWHKLTDEAKIDILGKAYDKGLKAGKAMFFNERGSELTKKQQKAGFNFPQPVTTP